MICWGAYANAILTDVLQIERNLDFGQSCKIFIFIPNSLK